MRFLHSRRYLLYVPISVTASGLMFLRSFMYAHIFSVESFGLLNQAILVASTFTALAGLGFHHAAQKLLPQYHTRGQRADFDALLVTCIQVCLVSALVAALVLTIASLLGVQSHGSVFFAALACGAAQYLFLLKLTEVRSEMRFMDHALQSAYRAIVLVMVAVTVAKLTGNVAATLLSEALVTLVLCGPLVFGKRGGQLTREALQVRARREWYSKNLPIALRLLWLNGTLTLLYAVDRWLGVGLLTEREYGIFAVGLIVISLFETLQSIVNVAAFPLMGRMIARGDFRRAFRFATLASAGVIVIGAICIIPFDMLLDAALRRFLPRYLEASSVIKFAVVVGIVRLADFYNSYSILMDAERRLATIALILLVSAGVMIVALASFDIVDFDPAKMMVVSICVAASVFVGNVSVATRAQRRKSAEMAAHMPS